ncbi:unnamed protein product [Closterium sp. NIES-54]
MVLSRDGLDSENYTLTFIDACTRYVWAVNTDCLSLAFECFVAWMKRAERQSGLKLKTYQTYGAVKQRPLRQIDVASAFMYAPIGATIFVERLHAFEETDGAVCLLQKSLYGIKKAPRVWQQYLHTVLTELGFTQLPHDLGMYHKESRGKFILVTYVDDLLYTSDDTELLGRFEADIKGKLEVTINHNITQFLGLNITQSATSIHLSAAKYAETLVKKFAVAPINLTTPFRTPPPNHEPENTPLSIEDHRLYQQQLGCLLFAAVMCWPDLSYVASQLTHIRPVIGFHFLCSVHQAQMGNDDEAGDGGTEWVRFQRSTGDPRLILGKGYRLVVLGGYGRTDPLLNKPFCPNGLVVGILTWYQSKGLGFESQCVHFGHPSAGGCQRSTGDPRLILGKGYRLVVLGGYGRTDPLLNKPFYPNGLVVGILTCDALAQKVAKRTTVSTSGVDRYTGNLRLQIPTALMNGWHRRERRNLLNRPQ